VIRVAIADDHALVRGGLRMIIEAQNDMIVAAEAENGREIVESLRTASVDVVLMDVRMPKMDGLEATRRLVAGGNARVIVLTTFDVDDYVFEALKAGASGYLLKSTPPRDLVAAIRTAAAGGDVLGPTVLRRLVQNFVQRPDRATKEEVMRALSERELEVLRMLARGRSNAEIGRDLFISEATVKTHLTRVLTKLGVRDRLQAVIRAYEVGLVEPRSRDD
jgi:DNA-binding NarL/FixJ family response regulator